MSSNSKTKYSELSENPRDPEHDNGAMQAHLQGELNHTDHDDGAIVLDIESDSFPSTQKINDITTENLNKPETEQNVFFIFSHLKIRSNC